MFLAMRVNVTIPVVPCAARRAVAGPLLLAGAALGLHPAVTSAQAGLTGTQDAVPVPRGAVRVSLTPSWMRYDSRFDGRGGTTKLGALLSDSALGTAQLPALTTYEGALRILTGQPALSLSLGRARATASVRVVTTPISIEYGVTRRLSLGVTVPIVQRQRELVLSVDPRGPLATANVGPVGSQVRPQQQAQASALAVALDAAAATLTQRIAQCDAAPSSTGCAAIVGDRNGASATAFAARQTAMSVRYVYGTGASSPGAIGLTPLASMSGAIEAQLEQLNARFAAYLGGTPLAVRTAPVGAQVGPSATDVRAITRAGLVGIGPDSLARTVKIGIGDVEIGAKFLLLDRTPRSAPGESIAASGLRLRMIAGAVARLATGAAASDDELFVVGGGDGQPDAEASLAVDMDGAGRLGGTLLARYTAQLGSVAATRVPDSTGTRSPFGQRFDGVREPGDILALEASPRVRLGSSMYVVGHYAMLRRADDHFQAAPATGVVDPLPLPRLAPLPASVSAGGFTEQRAGLGITYSTVARWGAARVSLPIEVSYLHMENVSGSSAMVPRAGRDQIQVRLYYRLRR